jgi:hypothetical protein
MQRLYIEPSKTTPEINFSPDENTFIIRGISSPEDVRALYYPVIEWVILFVDDIIDGTVTLFNKESPFRITIDLSYFNSSSAKFLLDILIELKRLRTLEIPIIIEWLSDPEDSDMIDAGADIAQLVEMEFNFLSKIKKPL